jgi:hypothetical protein
MDETIPAIFISYASGILAETNTGLTGPKIVEVCNIWAIREFTETPHSEYPFHKSTPNKRTALKENILAFEPKTQYRLILDLCDKFEPDAPPEVIELRKLLNERYSHFSIEKNGESDIEINIDEAVTKIEKPKARKTDFYEIKASNKPESVTEALKIFLCHASNDKPEVEKLYILLKEQGFEPWLDKFDLVAGQKWRIEIPKAVKDADIVLVCLSKHSINKEGYVQKEIKFALDIAEEKPEAMMYIIPAKLEKCSLPTRLEHIHCVNLFDSEGELNLIKSLTYKCESKKRLCK